MKKSKPKKRGRPRGTKGPAKVKLSPMVLERTETWLRKQFPDAKTASAAAARMLDELAA